MIETKERVPSPRERNECQDSDLGCGPAQTQVIEELPENIDKEAWLIAGRPRCIMCGRGISDPVSIQRGVGSDCWKKYKSGHRTDRARRLASAMWVLETSDDELSDAGLSVPQAKRHFAKSILKKLNKAQPLAKKQRANSDKMATSHLLNRFNKLRAEAPDSLLIIIEGKVHLDSVVTTINNNGRTCKVNNFSLGWD